MSSHALAVRRRAAHCWGVGPPGSARSFAAVPASESRTARKPLPGRLLRLGASLPARRRGYRGGGVKPPNSRSINSANLSAPFSPPGRRASIEPHDSYRGPLSEQTAPALAEAPDNLANGAFDIALALEFGAVGIIKVLVSHGLNIGPGGADLEI